MKKNFLKFAVVAVMFAIAAWEAECYSDNEAIAKANPLPCFDINDFN